MTAEQIAPEGWRCSCCDGAMPASEDDQTVSVLCKHIVHFWLIITDVYQTVGKYKRFQKLILFLLFTLCSCSTSVSLSASFWWTEIIPESRGERGRVSLHWHTHTHTYKRLSACVFKDSVTQKWTERVREADDKWERVGGGNKHAHTHTGFQLLWGPTF